MKIFFAILVCLVCRVGIVYGGQNDLLEPAKAFSFSVGLSNPETVEVRYQIASGYYLYRDKFRFASQSSDVSLSLPRFPPGKIKEDPLFGRVETYRNRVIIPISVTRMKPINEFGLKVTSQGCADAGVCYPPQEQVVTVNFFESGSRSSSNKTDMFSTFTQSEPLSSEISNGTREQAGDSLPRGEENRLARLLTMGGFWVAIASFFGFGLALAFTPCVYPMIPILSAIIVGRGNKLTKVHGFALSLAYVLGMAITYAVVGVAAGLTGSLFTHALQNAWVLGAFAAVMVILAFAMFGFYELQLPSFIQSKFSSASNKLRGGHFAAVFVMGALSAVIVGPCVAPPLAAALLVISQTRDLVLGGSALFSMALGMGVPLIVVGVSAGTLLPKTGTWMETVKRFFGAILLGVAIWLISPVIPALAHMLLWTALLIISAIYLHAIDPLPPGASGLRKFWKGMGVILLLLGVAILVGALSGNRDVLQPLAGFRATSEKRVASGPGFELIASIGELEKRLASAKGRPIILDFYADWCVSCQEMDRFTFGDDNVISKLTNFVKIRVNVTSSSEEDRALLKRFNLFGPPGIVFFDGFGQELKGFRVIGFQPPDQFLVSINKVLKNEEI